MILKKTTVRITEPYTVNGEWVPARFVYIETLQIGSSVAEEISRRGDIWNRKSLEMLVDDCRSFFSAMPEVVWDDSFPVVETTQDDHTDVSYFRLVGKGRFELSDDETKNTAMLAIVSHPVDVVDSVREVVLFG